MTIELKKRDYAITVHDIDLDYIKGSEVRIIEDGFIHHYLATADISPGCRYLILCGNTYIV